MSSSERTICRDCKFLWVERNKHPQYSQNGVATPEGHILESNEMHNPTNGTKQNTDCHLPSLIKWILNYRVVISEVSSHGEEPQTYLEANKARYTGRAIKLCCQCCIGCTTDLHRRTKTKIKFCIFVGRSACFTRVSCSLEKSECTVHHNYIRSIFCAVEFLLNCYYLDVFFSHSVCQ